MSLRLEMLQVARLADRQLREATHSVAEFLRRQFNPDGGAADRDGQSDLYYTVFALDGLNALREEVPDRQRTLRYLAQYETGDGLDFVQLSSLARAHAALDASPGAAASKAWLQRLEGCRSLDGGYASQPGLPQGTAYHAYLALGAYQDLCQALPGQERLLESLQGLRSLDGGFGNLPGMPAGTTTATAAVAALHRNLGCAPPPGVDRWLTAQFHPEGGFVATPGAGLPDLLSTATALHALKAPMDGLREKCLDFVDTLWTGKAFCGHWADDVEDSEYTFYGLLALGHLSL